MHTWLPFASCLAYNYALALGFSSCVQIDAPCPDEGRISNLTLPLFMTELIAGQLFLTSYKTSSRL